MTSHARQKYTCVYKTYGAYHPYFWLTQLKHLLNSLSVTWNLFNRNIYNAVLYTNSTTIRDHKYKAEEFSVKGVLEQWKGEP